MNGKNGVYELVYFVKDSKSLQRFKVAASQFDSFTKDKSDAAIERLVSYNHPRTWRGLSLFLNHQLLSISII